MMRKNNLFFSVFLFLFFTGPQLQAQNLLGNVLSIDYEKNPVSEVLKQVERKSGCTFSYNSNILPVDSVVSLHAKNITVKDMLGQLLGNRFEFREAHKFIIIRYAPLELSLIVSESFGNTEQYTISGQVVDRRTGKPLQDASVYEKNKLESALTDENGLFTLHFKNIEHTLAVSITKENYKEITSFFLSEVAVGNNVGENRFSEYADDTDDLEETVFGRRFISSAQRIQSINLGNFVAGAPVQASLTPKLNTHGSLSGQIVNRFSLNLTGAYSAGVSGGEVALLFNLTKHHVKYFQFAGGFNLTGGTVTGMQVAGGYNHVLGNVRALQYGTIFNRVDRGMTGMQVALFYNAVRDTLKGIQFSPGYNRVNKTVKGMQIAGVLNHIKLPAKSAYGAGLSGMQLAVLGNITAGTVRGAQVGGLFNYAKNLRGFQFGLINVADTSSGFSLGLINIVPQGYHRLSLSTNEILPFNAAIKTGNPKLYTQLLFANSLNPAKKLTAIGFGFGSEGRLGSHFSINPELGSQYIYQGRSSAFNLLNRFELNVNYHISKWIGIYAGPALNVYYTEQTTGVNGYDLIAQNRKTIFARESWRGWIGWNFGISLF